MKSLDIKINTKELTHYSRFLDNRIKGKTLLLIISNFAKYVRELYLELLEDSINSKRYEGEWEPVEDAGYQEYLGATPTGDIMSLLRDAMEVKKIGNNYIIRINPYYMYPGTKIPLVKVLKAIEAGTSQFNARPLIFKINVTIRTSMKSLWRGFLAMKGVVGG